MVRVYLPSPGNRAGSWKIFRIDDKSAIPLEAAVAYVGLARERNNAYKDGRTLARST